MITLTEQYQGLPCDSFGASTSFTGTSDYILMKAMLLHVSVAIHPAAGQTARAEYTLDGPSMIDGGTAVWQAWPRGNVSSSTDDALLTGVAAIRGVSSGGTARLVVLAK